MKSLNQLDEDFHDYLKKLAESIALRERLTITPEIPPSSLKELTIRNRDIRYVLVRGRRDMFRLKRKIEKYSKPEGIMRTYGKIIEELVQSIDPYILQISKNLKRQYKATKPVEIAELERELQEKLLLLKKVYEEEFHKDLYLLMRTHTPEILRTFGVDPTEGENPFRTVIRIYAEINAFVRTCIKQEKEYREITLEGEADEFYDRQISYKAGFCDVVEERGLAVVGMSPGNSYFTSRVIQLILMFAHHRFSRVRIMIPDEPAVHTYQAIGNSPKKAARKARLSGNTLKNHCKRSMRRIKKRDSDADIELIEWKDEITPSPYYHRAYEEMLNLYNTNGSFRQDAREATREVIENRLKKGVEIESAIDEGVKYLLKELAFLIASPQILGTDKVAYVYHNRWLIFEALLEGKYTGRRIDNVQFVVAA